MKRPGTLVLFAALIGGCTVLADIDDENVVYVEACTPREERACYSGPEGTEGVGACKGGTQVCNAEGKGFGPCEGEVTPASGNCAPQEDVNCNDVECTGAYVWSKAFGVMATEYGRDVATDSEGNVVLTGFLSDAVKPDDAWDVFVVKLDASSGKELWSKSFGDDAFDEGASVAIDSADNVVLVGHFDIGLTLGYTSLKTVDLSRDIFVAKLSTTGVPLWVKGFGGSKEQDATSVATDSEDNIVLTGYFEGTDDFEGNQLPNAGDRDIFVAKLDATGEPLWSKRFVYPGVQEGTSVATDSAGNVVLTGFFEGEVNFEPGGVPLTTSLNAGDRDIFVAKFDPSGKHLWSKDFGDASVQEAASVATDSAGNIVLTGDFMGEVNFGKDLFTNMENKDVFVVKFDAQGEHLWSKSFGDLGPQEGASVATDSADNVVLTGYFGNKIKFGDSGTEHFSEGANRDIFLAKFNADGVLVWSNHFGDETMQEGLSVATDSAGNVALTGYFNDTTDFGGGPLSSKNQEDIFVAKFSP